MADETEGTGTASDPLLRASAPGLNAPAFAAAETDEDAGGPSAFGSTVSLDMTAEFMNLSTDEDDTGDNSVNTEFAAAFSKPASSRPATPTKDINASLLDDDTDGPLAVPVIPEDVPVEETVAVTETVTTVAPVATPAETPAAVADEAPADETEAKPKSSKKVLVLAGAGVLVAVAAAAVFTFLS